MRGYVHLGESDVRESLALGLDQLTDPQNEINELLRNRLTKHEPDMVRTLFSGWNWKSTYDSQRPSRCLFGKVTILACGPSSILLHRSSSVTGSCPVVVFSAAGSSISYKRSSRSTSLYAYRLLGEFPPRISATLIECTRNRPCRSWTKFAVVSRRLG